MELRTRCRLIPALFAFIFCAVPALSQETPEPPTATGDPTPSSADQDPVAQAPGVPDAQPFFVPGSPGQDRQFAPMVQPFYGQQPAMMFNPMMQQSPELAKKMRAVMGLRAMWQLRLTAKDIAAILSPLKELSQAEKNLQAHSEQILEDERKALLSADPNGDPPEGSGDLMQRENDLYRIKSDDIWRAIDKSIGKEKTNGLRRLVGMGGQQIPFVDYGGDAGIPRFDGGELAPDAAQGRGGQPPRAIYGDPSRPLPKPNRQGRDVAPNAAPATGQPGGQSVPRANNPLGSVPLINRLFENKYTPQAMPQVRLSLTELVSLLTDKQAAMRK